jgi:hypothetical protein
MGIDILLARRSRHTCTPSNPRQHHVEDDEVVLLVVGLEFEFRVFTREEGVDRIALASETALQGFCQPSFVLDDEDPHDCTPTAPR